MGIFSNLRRSPGGTRQRLAPAVSSSDLGELTSATSDDSFDAGPSNTAPDSGPDPADPPKPMSSGQVPFTGAYLMVPPIETHVAAPVSLAGSPQDFLSTRRPIRVSARSLTHQIDPVMAGLLRAPLANSAGSPQSGESPAGGPALVYRQQVEQEIPEAEPDEQVRINWATASRPVVSPVRRVRPVAQPVPKALQPGALPPTRPRQLSAPAVPLGPVASAAPLDPELIAEVKAVTAATRSGDAQDSHRSAVPMDSAAGAVGGRAAGPRIRMRSRRTPPADTPAAAVQPPAGDLNDRQPEVDHLDPLPSQASEQLDAPTESEQAAATPTLHVERAVPAKAARPEPAHSAPRELAKAGESTAPANPHEPAQLGKATEPIGGADESAAAAPEVQGAREAQEVTPSPAPRAPELGTPDAPTQPLLGASGDGIQRSAARLGAPAFETESVALDSQTVERPDGMPAELPSMVYRSSPRAEPGTNDGIGDESAPAADSAVVSDRGKSDSANRSADQPARKRDEGSPSEHVGSVPGVPSADSEATVPAVSKAEAIAVSSLGPSTAGPDTTGGVWAEPNDEAAQRPLVGAAGDGIARSAIKAGDPPSAADDPPEAGGLPPLGAAGQQQVSGPDASGTGSVPLLHRSSDRDASPDLPTLPEAGTGRGSTQDTAPVSNPAGDPSDAANESVAARLVDDSTALVNERPVLHERPVPVNGSPAHSQQPLSRMTAGAVERHAAGSHQPAADDLGRAAVAEPPASGSAIASGTSAGVPDSGAGAAKSVAPGASVSGASVPGTSAPAGSASGPSMPDAPALGASVPGASASGTSVLGASVPGASVPGASVSDAPASGASALGASASEFTAASSPPGLVGSRPLIGDQAAGIQRAATSPGEVAAGVGRPVPDSGQIVNRRQSGSAKSADHSGLEGGDSRITMSLPPRVQAVVRHVSGVNPGSVSITRGAEVDRRARKLSANAFTEHGRIHLPGQVPLTSARAQQLLAHEAIHVIQHRQRGGRMPDEGTPEGQALERQAQQAEQAMASGSWGAGHLLKVVAGGGAVPAGSAVGAALNDVPQSAGTHSTNAPLAGTQPTRPGPKSSHALGLPPKRTPPLIKTRDTAAMVAAKAQQAAADAVDERLGAEPAETASLASHPTRTSGAAGSGSGVQRSVNLESLATDPELKALRSQANGVNQPPQPAGSDPATDRASIERHAKLLYPVIRGLLRAELLRDRERRGQMFKDW